MNDEPIRTGELSERAGVNKETLRFYEKNKLIREPERTPTGYRIYSDSDVQRVMFIKNAQKLGFSLKEIRELLSLADGEIIECGEVRAIAEKKLQFVRNQIDSLRCLESVLADLIKRCARSKTINYCPIIESISEGSKADED